MNFRLGQLISAYDKEGYPVSGRICGFGDNSPEFGPLATVRTKLQDRNGDTVYVEIRLDTAHPLPVNEVKHTKESFLAASSRCSPVLYFKDDKARRDYLEGLWQELSDFSKD